MAFVLITGGAGFIGYHLQQQLQSKYLVNAIDLINEPTPAIKLRKSKLKHVVHADINSDFLNTLEGTPEVIIHLAAETGIAGSLTHPQKYFDTNVAGTFNVLEQCRKAGIKYLIYASSSSVYAPNQLIMQEDSNTINQLSYYGTTKKMDEVMIENYCKQFGITAIGLRFFTISSSKTRLIISLISASVLPSATSLSDFFIFLPPCTSAHSRYCKRRASFWRLSAGFCEGFEE